MFEAWLDRDAVDRRLPPDAVAYAALIYDADTLYRIRSADDGWQRGNAKRQDGVT